MEAVCVPCGISKPQDLQKYNPTLKSGLTIEPELRQEPGTLGGFVTAGNKKFLITAIMFWQ